MLFEWDDKKNATNLKKHGIEFEVAISIFKGLVLTKTDSRVDYAEVREISLGEIGNQIVIVIVHTDRKNVTRVISARPASKTERKKYYAYCKKIIE